MERSIFTRNKISRKALEWGFFAEKMLYFLWKIVDIIHKILYNINMDELRERSCHYRFIRKKMARGWRLYDPVRNGTDYCERALSGIWRAQSTTRYKRKVGHVCFLYFFNACGIKGEKYGILYCHTIVVHL